MRGSALALLAVLGWTAACNEPSAPESTATAPRASTPHFTRPAKPAAPPAPNGSAEVIAASTTGPAPTATATATAEAPPPPAVDVKTIGMHIGGGPNDKKTKAPIRRAVEARLDAFRSCFALVDEPGKGGTFGADVRIPGEGGKPSIRDPRCGLRGEGVEPCLVEAFESVEFERPPNGLPMVVSYSLRFTPK